jgi:hypothetical protein
MSLASLCDAGGAPLAAVVDRPKQVGPHCGVPVFVVPAMPPAAYVLRRERGVLVAAYVGVRCARALRRHFARKDAGWGRRGAVRVPPLRRGTR